MNTNCPDALTLAISNLGDEVDINKSGDSKLIILFAAFKTKALLPLYR